MWLETEYVESDGDRTQRRSVDVAVAVLIGSISIGIVRRGDITSQTAERALSADCKM